MAIIFFVQRLFRIAHSVVCFCNCRSFHLKVHITYSMGQNYPNPFNPSTIIRFGLPENTRVNLIIYNQIGEQVAELVNGQMAAGYHQVTWNATHMSSGVYFYRITTEKFRSVKKLLLLK